MEHAQRGMEPRGPPSWEMSPRKDWGHSWERGGARLPALKSGERMEGAQGLGLGHMASTPQSRTDPWLAAGATGGLGQRALQLSSPSGGVAASGLARVWAAGEVVRLEGVGEGLGSRQHRPDAPN